MKKTLLLMLFASLLISCGTVSNLPKNENGLVAFNGFTVENQNVVWSHVYNHSGESSDKIQEWFKSNYKISSADGGVINGETNKCAVPYGEAGYGSMNVVMLLTHPCVVNFTVQFKEDRYRVIVNSIIWYPDMTVYTSGIGVGVGTITLNEAALGQGGVKSSFYNTSSVQLDKALTCLFSSKQNSSVKQNDNW